MRPGSHFSLFVPASCCGPAALQLPRGAAGAGRGRRPGAGVIDLGLLADGVHKSSDILPVTLSLRSSSQN